jgi:parvulin-like peptidyl-prolyl isomerase
MVPAHPCLGENHMAKSAQKRGRSKGTRKQDKSGAPAKQTRKQIALGRKEARQNRIILLSVGALVLVIALVVIVGVAQELILKPSTPVATVNGTNIRLDDFEDVLAYRRYNLHANESSLQNSLSTLDPEDANNEFLISFYQQQLAQVQSALALAADDALDELIEDALIEEKAAELAITVTNEEVEQSINEDLEQVAAPQSQETITGTEQLSTPIPQSDLDEIYNNVLNNLGLNDAAFKAIVRRGMLRERVQEALAEQVPTTGLVANVQMLETHSEEDASSAKARIEAGEEFGVVAQEVMTGTAAADGWDLGWITTGQLSTQYGEGFEEQVFSAEPGQLTLIENDGRYFVVLVVEREENGPLPESVLTLRQNSALSDWLEERKNNPDVQIEKLLEPSQIPPDPFVTGGGS